MRQGGGGEADTKAAEGRALRVRRGGNQAASRSGVGLCAWRPVGQGRGGVPGGRLRSPARARALRLAQLGYAGLRWFNQAASGSRVRRGPHPAPVSAKADTRGPRGGVMEPVGEVRAGWRRRRVSGRHRGYAGD